MDLSKHDLTLNYAERTFSLRAYQDRDHPDGAGWHAVVVENRTPLPCAQRPAESPADCFAEAVRFVVGFVAAPVGVASARR